LLGLAWLLTAAAPGGAAAVSPPSPTLRVLAWPGYVDADVVSAFEQRSGVKVELTLVDTDEALWQKISANNGADFDVFAVNTAELQRYIDRQLVLPIAPQNVPNTRHQQPRFRDLNAIPGLVRNGEIYGIPYTFAEMGLIYDRQQIAQPPESVTALWDPRYRGRVLAYNGGTHNFSLAALALGSRTPFQIAPDDWPRVAEQLIALRRNVLAFYTQPQESVDLFRRHHAALMFANYGTQQMQLLQAAGADVGYTIPREGALAWLDCWVIARGAQDRLLASSWINYMLNENVSALLVSRQGLNSTVAPLPANRAAAHLLWLEPAGNIARRTQWWSRILSGDRLDKVMAP
jgi:putative spermidine/putrescine transport system substrate-binding protein